MTVLVLPYARAYARHLGLEPEEEELREALRRRLSLAPPLGRFLCAAGALLCRWVFPLLFARRLPPFDRLASEDKELMLQRLQSHPSAALKGVFVSLRSVLLPLCYADPKRLSRLGYDLDARA